MSYKFDFEVVPVSEAVCESTPVSQVELSPVEEQLPTPANKPPVILIVDDEKLIADTLSAILARSGLSTMTAYDAASALDLARVTSPEVLLTDVAMPGMDGIDLAIALTRASPTCKVLLFSGHASSAHLVKARSAGHDFPLMSKPIHPIDMLKRVSEVISDRLAELNRRHIPAVPHIAESAWTGPEVLLPAIA